MGDHPLLQLVCNLLGQYHKSIQLLHIPHSIVAPRLIYHYYAYHFPQIHSFRTNLTPPIKEGFLLHYKRPHPKKPIQITLAIPTSPKPPIVILGLFILPKVPYPFLLHFILILVLIPEFLNPRYWGLIIGPMPRFYLIPQFTIHRFRWFTILQIIPPLLPLESMLQSFPHWPTPQLFPQR